MLGGGSQGNGAFSCSSSSTLPPARRHHHQQTAATAAAAAAASCWNANNPFIGAAAAAAGSVVVPSTASEEAPALASNFFASATAALPVQRKRPGCLCDDYDDDDDQTTSTSASSNAVGNGTSCHAITYGDCSIQPLDLSLPKVKVRQHWSGGSIVQVNESTIISIGDCCGCPSSSAPSPGSSRLNVSVVTVPQQPCWAAASSRHSQHHHHHHHQHPVDRHQQQPFRLQIEIPLTADKLPGFFRHHHQQQQQQQQQHSHRRKSSSSSHCSGGSNNSTPAPASLRPPEVSVMTEEEDDLQRLSDSAHQLRLSGYYYGHLSWKESMQLLQNTKVGTFLVRDSSDARYLYALSLQTDKGPTSVRIHYSSRGFRLDASNTGMADHLPRFRTVLDLVDHYVAKWSQCRDKGQFWLDNSGQVHSEVVLIRPLMRDCPPLKHLCRLVWNQHRTTTTTNHQSSANVSSPSSVTIPPTIKSYLNEYPYLH